jgi:hypothetical protein
MDEHGLHGERTEDAPVTKNWNAEEHELGHRQVMEETPKVAVGSEAWLRNVKAALACLQPPISARERVLMDIEPLIQERRNAGCTPHQIAALLAANGVQITGTALARRLREKAEDGKTPGKKKKPSASLRS